jgi:hypothetical protein
MFAPGECLKAAVVCPVIAYVMATGVYHDSPRASLIFAAFVGAVIACFGIIGLLGG